MQPPIILAHGALGIWDEVIFLSIAAVFLVMMGISWVRNRNVMPDFEDPQPPAETSSAANDNAPSRFRLD